MSFLSYLRELGERFSDALSEDVKDVDDKIMDAVRRGFEEIKEDVEEFLADLKASALAHPDPAFALLRRIQPIFVIRNFALITRFEDVQEVLSRDGVFDVTYADKMRRITNGENFFLGMRNTPRYTRDVSNMRICVRREDVPRIVAPFVSNCAADIVTRSSGRLDVVSELTRVVPTQLVGAYFGTPGPSETELADWTSTLFRYLFLDQGNDEAVAGEAQAASESLNGYLDGLIHGRKAKPSDSDDVLERCLGLQSAGIPGMEDLDIRNNLLGLLIGAIPTTSASAALALDQLLARPAVLEAAGAAARADDDALLARYVFEALRFNPLNPGIFRNTLETYTLAKGERRATTIEQGTTVLAATRSAMFDHLEVDAPDDFHIDRPAYHYMLWGYGLHTCYGQYINQVQIPGILKPLLARENLRRLPGEAGELRYDGGPFPTGLGVAFD